MHGSCDSWDSFRAAANESMAAPRFNRHSLLFEPGQRRLASVSVWNGLQQVG